MIKHKHTTLIRMLKYCLINHNTFLSTNFPSFLGGGMCKDIILVDHFRYTIVEPWKC